MRNFDPDAIISVVAPFYNEVKGIKVFVEELETEFDKIGYEDRHELVLVNDGSTDGSDRELDKWRPVTPAKSKYSTCLATLDMPRLFMPDWRMPAAKWSF
jgi:hypothetical protein